MSCIAPYPVSPACFRFNNAQRLSLEGVSPRSHARAVFALVLVFFGGVAVARQRPRGSAHLLLPCSGPEVLRLLAHCTALQDQASGLMDHHPIADSHGIPQGGAWVILCLPPRAPSSSRHRFLQSLPPPPSPLRSPSSALPWLGWLLSSPCFLLAGQRAMSRLFLNTSFLGRALARPPLALALPTARSPGLGQVGAT